MSARLLSLHAYQARWMLGLHFRSMIYEVDQMCLANVMLPLLMTLARIALV